jgi:hypothetical protein
VCITGDVQKVTRKNGLGRQIGTRADDVTQTVSLRPDKSKNRQLTACVTKSIYFSLRLRAIRSVWLRMRKSLSRMPVKRSTYTVPLSP